MIEAPHGGRTKAIAARMGVAPDEVLDLSASLNPVAPDPAPILARHLGAVGRYPDATEATASLAEAMGVDPDRLVLTNGGAEAIAVVAQLHPRGWADECDFSLYRRHLEVLDHAGPRWMSDPNNPTGRLADAGERAAVRDEAFYPLATGRWTRGDLDTVVVGSLTKLFACPGLRMGYVLAPDAAYADQVAERVPRWSFSGLACEALPDLIATADLPAWCSDIAALRCRLVDVLGAHGFGGATGAANYLWLPDAPGLQAHLEEHLIAIRSGSSFGRPDAVRIAVPPSAGIDRLAAALAYLKDPR